jgi:hypothetical protein
MAAFQFYLQSGKQRKVAGGYVRQVGWVGNESHVPFGQKFPGEKGSMHQPVLLSPKFEVKSSHIFKQLL